ncbi:Predicted arabinose efflux permease, MFS family [Rathayibacter oskolensis]|uniref:Predicted arabinose efflux permease, MFS family n=1 Tax=Rathayibacter oskolensis TaxID=1891671 RepID=A0A1X7P8K3_9MICO|nr:MFS transporter [Rathayibacter oskolensis]SMH46364.1 Predicted arabinose efflux permease, MFS family [Rathayibacter oskolensis]
MSSTKAAAPAASTASIAEAAPTAPIAVVDGPPAWRNTFQALEVPNFRIYTGAHFIGSTAMWIQRIAQDWLVLELTGSVVAVGITVALQFAPLLVFGLYGGVLADRYPKRILLITAQSTAAVLSAVLGVLTVSGAVEPWHIFTIAFLLGFVTVIDNPTRQAFVTEVVGPVHLRNAISINATVFQLGALIGPAISGVLILAVGSGPAFLINASAALVAVTGLASMNARALHTVPRLPRARGQLREGVAYVLGKPAIAWSLLLVAVASTFAFNTAVVFADYAANEFDAGAGGYGLFSSMAAVGAVLGAVASTRRVRLRLRTVVGGAVVYGAFEMLAAAMPTQGMFAVSLIGVGLGNLLFVTAANALIQSSSNVSVRGRVMSIYVLVLLGFQTIGAPLIGGLSELLGPRATLATMGGVLVLGAAVVALIVATRARMGLQFSPRGVRIVDHP